MIIYGSARHLFEIDPVVSPQHGDDIQNPVDGDRRRFLEEQKAHHLYAYQLGPRASYTPRWEFDDNGEIVAGQSGDLESFVMTLPLRVTHGSGDEHLFTRRPDLGAYRVDTPTIQWVSVEVRVFSEGTETVDFTAELRTDDDRQWARTMSVNGTEPARCVIRFPLQSATHLQAWLADPDADAQAVLSHVELGMCRFGGDLPRATGYPPQQRDQAGMDAAHLEAGNLIASRRTDIAPTVYTDGDTIPRMTGGNADLIGELPEISGYDWDLREGTMVYRRFSGPSPFIEAVELEESAHLVSVDESDDPLTVDLSDQYLAAACMFQVPGSVADPQVICGLWDDDSGDYFALLYTTDESVVAEFTTSGGSTESTAVISNPVEGEWWDLVFLVGGDGWSIWDEDGYKHHSDDLGISDVTMQVGLLPAVHSGFDGAVAYPWASWCGDDRAYSDVAGYVESYRAWRWVVGGPRTEQDTGGVLITGADETYEIQIGFDLYEVHEWHEDGTVEIGDTLNVEYFLVGGGTNGGSSTTLDIGAGSGGAGGEVVDGSGEPINYTPGVYTIQVGDGGSPVGQDSTLEHPTGEVVAKGGGGDNDLIGRGGSAGRWQSTDVTSDPETGTIADGGNYSYWIHIEDDSEAFAGGGGGGASGDDGDDGETDGASAPEYMEAYGGDGGDGVESSFFGSPEYYGGGGGGSGRAISSSQLDISHGDGGLGGGGGGGFSGNNGEDGKGGGGGGGTDNGAGGEGGRGRVGLRRKIGEVPLPVEGGDEVYPATIDGTDYAVHEFHSDGQFEVTDGPVEMDVMLLGGGAGAGSGDGVGGGGGGELRTHIDNSIFTYGDGTYSVEVGAGGTGADTVSGATNGEASGVDTDGSGFVDVAGGGASHTDGGCGGGGTSGINDNDGGLSESGGNNGGDAQSPGFFADHHAGGGGGGADEAGADGNNDGSGGDGGDGFETDFTGETIRIGAGGGGCAVHDDGTVVTPGQGGAGGGGDAEGPNDSRGQDGTGLGAGGGAGATGTGGDGTQGRVWIRYEL